MSKDVAVEKCVNCGADMVFSPEKGKLLCPYCDSTKDIEKTIAPERDYYAERSHGEAVDTAEAYQCPNCRGEVVLDNFATAKACPFCGATNVVKKDVMVGLKPDSILPFALSQARAAESGAAWIKKRLFAPAKVKKNFSPDKFNGVYVPSFSFTSASASVYKGRLGEYYYVTVGSGDNKHKERRTRWFDVDGRLDKVFPDMIVESSRQLEQKEMNAILPYDTGAAEEYKRQYVAGFSAERYDSGLNDCFGIAKEQMDVEIRSAVLSRYKYDVVDYLNVNTSYPSVLFHYLLLPLWVCGYKFKEKLYRFIVNGRTGKSTGKYPVSPARVSCAVFLGLAVVAGIVALVLHYLGVF